MLVQLQKFDPVCCLLILVFDKFEQVTVPGHYLLNCLVMAQHSIHFFVSKFDHHAWTKVDQFVDKYNQLSKCKLYLGL